MKTMIASLIGQLLLLPMVLLAGRDSISPVQKGEQVPDVHFKETRGNKSQNSHLGAYKNKWILLDFWSMHCVDCIAGLPKMDSLQAQFGDQLKVIVVTPDEQKKVENLWKRFADKPFAKKWVEAGSSMSFIMEDTVLVRMFPHIGVPTHVWIDPTQSVHSISYANTTTAENVEKLLANEPVFLQEKKIIEMDYYDPISWLDPQKHISDKVRYFSFLFNRFELGHFMRIQEPIMDSTRNLIVGYSCVNSSIVDLYKLAFRQRGSILGGQPGEIPVNRILVESQNKSRFIKPDDAESFAWRDANNYCYAAKYNVNNDMELEENVQSELDRYFKVKSRIEKRSIRCNILKGFGKMSKAASRSKETFARVIPEQGKLYLILQNCPVQTLYSYLNRALVRANSPLPFFNESDRIEAVSLKLPWSKNMDETSIAAIKACLKTFGFELAEENREIEMLVLTDMN